MPEAAANGALLSVRDLHSWYGESHVLHGATFDVATGEVVTLLGRNGAGKTTALKSIMGILGERKGSVVFDGVETIRLPSNRIARMGLGRWVLAAARESRAANRVIDLARPIRLREILRSSRATLSLRILKDLTG